MYFVVTGTLEVTQKSLSDDQEVNVYIMKALGNSKFLTECFNRLFLKIP